VFKNPNVCYRSNKSSTVIDTILWTCRNSFVLPRSQNCDELWLSCLNVTFWCQQFCTIVSPASYPGIEGSSVFDAIFLTFIFFIFHYALSEKFRKNVFLPNFGRPFKIWMAVALLLLPTKLQPVAKFRECRSRNVAESWVEKTSTKGTVDPEGVCATVVTAGHCTHAELTSGHALAGCYSCCV